MTESHAVLYLLLGDLVTVAPKPRADDALEEYLSKLFALGVDKPHRTGLHIYSE
jgi:hypothetical protein